MHKKTKELNELLDIYEIELCNRIFKYQLKNKIDIEIVFYKENFCHLLGLQHVYKKNKKYLGINGYNKIKNGQLKRSDLKKHNKAEYNKLEIRLDHFDEISNMLRNGHFIKFYQYRTKEKDINLIQREIQAIIRQITASVTFLPLLDEPCILFFNL